jgi:DNA invertase Pin-like site-specific DNA recombinase
MADARRRLFDVILVARFDRFARSTKHLLLALEELNSLRLDFISLSESIDTSTALGRMTFTVIAAVAELERSLVRERVAMGLSRARKSGTRLGRPRVRVDSAAVAELRTQGYTWLEISELLGISPGAAQRSISF